MSEAVGQTDSTRPVSKVLDTLSSYRARTALEIICEEDNGKGVSQNQVVEILTQRQYNSLERKLYKRVYVSLVQTHIPKLVDSGFVEKTKVEVETKPHKSDEEITKLYTGERGEGALSVVERAEDTIQDGLRQ